jgi:hypothetical protein
MAAHYDSLNASNASPYGSGDPFLNQSTGYITPAPTKKPTKNWIKFGVPVLILVVIGAVVGGVVGTRHKNNSSASSSSSGAGTASGEAAASSAASVKAAIGRFPTATDSFYLVPLYPSTTASAYSTPTFIPSNNAALTWPADTFAPANPNVLTVRPDRPRLIAPSYKWTALQQLALTDPYLKGWNVTIMANATAYYNLVPVVYHMDGASGILDNSREIKMRIKAFAYAYRMTGDSKWVDRAWAEVQNAGSSSFGPDTDKWNSVHFLDVAEMTAAFAIAYDWLYDMWTADQKSSIMSTMIKYGLSFGVSAYTDATVSYGWWRTNTNGNWNCVCNNGLTMGSLAILGDDTSGVAQQLLGLTVDNAKANCALGPSTDGTWSETANYWYFGTTGHAEMASSLLTATGSDYGLLDVNPDFVKTGTFHMNVFGTTSLFDYGDHGPNKFSTTANAMLLYAEHYNQPQFALFQRDQHDAPEPWSMFWYDPSVSGAFWDGQPLDTFFDDGLDQWGAMRSSWTDHNALYIAIKAGKNQGHQTHNDLDVGDFVLDALGTRWAGELGSADYLSPGYFSNDSQDSQRWLYYRKMTEGQNTILINQENQLVTAAPTINHGSSGTTQGASTVFTVPSDSTAYWTTDMTSAYTGATSVKRGIRMLNGRQQVLLQDDITATGTVQWRMHTNATVSIDTGGTSATLQLAGQTMKVSMVNPPSGAQFGRTDAVRFATDPTPPEADQPNPGVSVLTISGMSGTFSLQVLFAPQWSGAAAVKTPASVPLDSWSLTSHS